MYAIASSFGLFLDFNNFDSRFFSDVCFVLFYIQFRQLYFVVWFIISLDFDCRVFYFEQNSVLLDQDYIKILIIGRIVNFDILTFSEQLSLVNICELYFLFLLIFDLEFLG